MDRYNNPVWHSIVRVRRFCGRHPLLYFPLVKVVKPRTFPWAGVSRRTEIVIEGPSGSGNTFAYVAFAMAQPRPVYVAHHCHVPASIIRGIQFQIPTMVLLRTPADAVASALTRLSHLTLREALQDYCSFYQTVLPFRDRVVVARFDRVTADYGAVIEEVNQRFGSAFEPFRHTEENVRRCFQDMNSRSRGWEKNQPDQSRRESRKSVKGQLAHSPNRSLYNRALQLYEDLA